MFFTTGKVVGEFPPIGEIVIKLKSFEFFSINLLRIVISVEKSWKIPNFFDPQKIHLLDFSLFVMPNKLLGTSKE